MRLLRGILAFVIAGGAVAACAIDETHTETVVLPARKSSETITCTSPFVKPDLAQLTPCGDATRGKGHCYDAAKVPVPKSQLDPCADGSTYCVPDELLSAGGTKATGCTFFFDGKPGACVSLLTKDVFANKDLLKQDRCAPDERCLPCVDPRDGKDTSLCAETGAHEADCVGGPGEPVVSCCHDMGACVVPDALPEEIRASLVPQTCKDGKLCAAVSQLDAKPAMCEYLGTKGVCLDVCFAANLRGMTALSRGGCGPTELCMPCVLANAMSHDLHLIGCG